VLEQHTASVFHLLFDPEDEDGGSTLLGKVGELILNYMALHPTDNNIQMEISL
jgi:hypothetical protein